MNNKDPNRFYVYLHRRGDNNEVFYVGKGSGKRADSIKGRNSWWLRIYEKYGRTVEYVEKGMAEQDAYDLEIETIKFYRDCGHTLCNLTDGGGGVSGEYISLMCRKPDIYEFVNNATGETFKCTQYDLVDKYKLTWCDASRVVAGTHSAKNIGLLDYKFHEFKKYDFLVIKTGEVVNLTCPEAAVYFDMKYGSAYALAGGFMKSHKGITINGRDMPKQPTEYELRVISTGEIFKGTYKEIYDRFGIYSSALYDLVSGKLLTTKGCCLASTSDEDLVISDIVILEHVETGSVIEGTRKQIRDRLGITAPQLSNVTSGRSKTTKGYRFISIKES